MCKLRLPPCESLSNGSHPCMQDTVGPGCWMLLTRPAPGPERSWGAGELRPEIEAADPLLLLASWNIWLPDDSLAARDIALPALLRASWKTWLPEDSLAASDIALPALLWASCHSAGLGERSCCAGCSAKGETGSSAGTP